MLGSFGIVSSCRTGWKHFPQERHLFQPLIRQMWWKPSEVDFATKIRKLQHCPADRQGQIFKDDQHTSCQCNFDPWRCISRSYSQTDAQHQVWKEFEWVVNCWRKHLHPDIPQKDSCIGRWRSFRRQYFLAQSSFSRTPLFSFSLLRCFTRLSVAQIN